MIDLRASATFSENYFFKSKNCKKFNLIFLKYQNKTTLNLQIHCTVFLIISTIIHKQLPPIPFGRKLNDTKQIGQYLKEDAVICWFFSTYSISLWVTETHPTIYIIGLIAFQFVEGPALDILPSLGCSRPESSSRLNL